MSKKKIVDLAQYRKMKPQTDKNSDPSNNDLVEKKWTLS